MSEKRTNIQMFIHCLKYSALDVMTLGMYSGFRNIKTLEDNYKKLEEDRKIWLREYDIRMDKLKQDLEINRLRIDN